MNFLNTTSAGVSFDPGADMSQAICIAAGAAISQAAWPALSQAVCAVAAPLFSTGPSLQELIKPLEGLATFSKGLRSMANDNPDISQNLDEHKGRVDQMIEEQLSVGAFQSLDYQPLKDESIQISNEFCNSRILDRSQYCTGLNVDKLEWSLSDRVTKVYSTQGLDEDFSDALFQVVDGKFEEKPLKIGGALPILRAPGQFPTAIVRMPTYDIRHDGNLVARVVDHQNLFNVPKVAFVDTEGRKGVAVEFVEHDRFPGKEYWKEQKLPSYYYLLSEQMIDVVGASELQRTYLLDLVLNHQDRHQGNLLSKGEKVIPIDNDDCGYSIDILNPLRSTLFEGGIGGYQSIWRYKEGSIAPKVMKTPLSNEVRKTFAVLDIDEAEKRLRQLPTDYLRKRFLSEDGYRNDAFEDLPEEPTLEQVKAYVQRNVDEQAIALWVRGTAVKALVTFCETPEEVIGRAINEVNVAYSYAKLLARIVVGQKQDPYQIKQAFRKVFTKLLVPAAQGKNEAILEVVRSILSDQGIVIDDSLSIDTFHKAYQLAVGFTRDGTKEQFNFTFQKLTSLVDEEPVVMLNGAIDILVQLGMPFFTLKDFPNVKEQSELHLIIRSCQLTRAQTVGSLGSVVDEKQRKQVLEWGQEHFRTEEKWQRKIVDSERQSKEKLKKYHGWELRFESQYEAKRHNEIVEKQKDDFNWRVNGLRYNFLSRIFNALFGENHFSG